MANKTFAGITRRDFLKLTGSAATAAAVGSACTAGLESLTPENYSKIRPSIACDFEAHIMPLRGIDFQTTYDTPVTAPSISYVHGVVLNSAGAGGKMIMLETLMGHRISLLGCPDEMVAEGDSVTPLDIITMEYTAPDGRGRLWPHVHMHMMLPIFARLFPELGIRVNGEGIQDARLVNPHKYSDTGNLLTSIYKGDDSRITNLVKEAEARFNSLGEAYPKTHLGWFVNNSKDSRLFPRAVAAYIMLKDGAIEAAPKNRTGV